MWTLGTDILLPRTYTSRPYRVRLQFRQPTRLPAQILAAAAGPQTDMPCGECGLIGLVCVTLPPIECPCYQPAWLRPLLRLLRVPVDYTTRDQHSSALTTAEHKCTRLAGM